MSGLYLLMIVFGLGGMLISWRLKSKFQKYAQEPLRSNFSGEEIAIKMLADHGIQDVRVISVEGQLTSSMAEMPPPPLWPPTNVDMRFNMPAPMPSYNLEVPWFLCSTWPMVLCPCY
jgi:hypothetical protein